MSKRLTSAALTVLAAGAALPALAQQAARGGDAWSAQALSGANYVILAPRIEGNPAIVNDQQRVAILTAMKRDSAGAIKRRYPNASIVTNPQTPGTIKVTPVLETPKALLPWAKLTARLNFDLGSGQRVSLHDQFGLLVLWQHQAEAANYLYNELAKKLP